MTQEEKQLLLKDLCARIPYRTFVCLNPGAYNKPETCILTGVHGEKVHLNVDSDPFRIDHIKPYLRPMSSMTKEEKKIMRSCGFELIHYDTGHTGFANIENCIDEVSFRFMEEFLNAHHFDYRSLIPMGLAFEAPKDMYKTK